MIKVGVVGGTGYTGVELLRLLALHPEVQVRYSEFLYFSFVTLTTLGYGDMVAVSAAVRPLPVLEGVFGQFYLAVMIARLVGLHLARERE